MAETLKEQELVYVLVYLNPREQHVEDSLVSHMIVLLNEGCSVTRIRGPYTHCGVEDSARNPSSEQWAG